ncbi:MAG: hypothetical protein E7634_04870 [Ruminococcaceae bacterium]|nr:hypothetical protein [Oscillospiraceae bacterium]
MQGIYYLAEGFTDTYGDDWVARFIEKGVPTAVLGMVMIFAVLGLLWACLEVFKHVFYTIPERNKNGGAVKDEKPAPAPAPAAAPAPKTSADEEIVAAIIAAITAARAEEGIPASTAFRVVSFRKIR